MKLGAHVSTAGGIDKAIGRAVEVGCEAIQIFGSPPQSWAFKPAPESQILAFREQGEEAGIASVFFHAVYLINLGSPVPTNVEKGIESLVNYMTLAEAVGAGGVIFHPGSHKGAGYNAILQQTVSSIERVLERSPVGPSLTIENTAGMGQHIGASFDELGRIMATVQPGYRHRLKICLDTQHCFAAGYNVSTKDGLEGTLAEFDERIGLENLVAVHANDSKCPLGGGVDRHENIGQGHIGIQGFENIMSNPAFKDVPFFLEVPGFESQGPDRKNLEILKEIRSRVAPEG